MHHCFDSNGIDVETSAPVDHFWNAVHIWNDRPNLINKRLIGNEIIMKFRLVKFDVIDSVIDCLFRFICESAVVTSDSINDCLLGDFTNCIDFCSDSHIDIYIYVKNMIPKLSADKHCGRELTIFDYKNNLATFYNLEFESKNIGVGNANKASIFCYRLSYRLQENAKSCITLSFLQDYIDTGSSGSANYISIDKTLKSIREWLKNKLLPKIVRWAEEDDQHKGENACKTGSLRLIDVNAYASLYQKLKNVYGKNFVEIWPETTDPLKFVFEDVAIAAYLILLWQGKKQNFVDLGCGNGLLVHILTCEGHTGLGIDVRSRKIWELYPEGTAKLEVKTISPSSDDSGLYPDADWLIGNHSDELTPWIPVIASLSSYKCNYFLLPCCSYELNGQKYQRKNSMKSQYMDYLDYISSLCDFCGFRYEFDKLRIPSTKRICIVGNGRNYNTSEHEKKVSDVRNLINSKCCSNFNVDGDNIDCQNEPVSFDNFKARSSEIKARNCTQLDKNFVQNLVSLISKRLLNSVSVSNELKTDKIVWNEGKPISLSELARSLPNDCLKKLKKECGGLQTLIKNHHYIFKIDKGMVSFRKPSKYSDHRGTRKNVNNQSVNLKKKECWFHKNHPNKCPLTDIDCPFVHL